MYKQKPGDPLKKLDSPTTFREDSPMMKMAKDGSNPLFKMDSGLYKHTPGHKEKDEETSATEKLDEVVVYAPYKNRKKPSEVGGTDAQVSGGKKFKVKKGKPVI
jgi:hypothetical protein